MKNKFLKLVLILILFWPVLAFGTPDKVDFLLAGLSDSSGTPLSGGKIYTYTAGTLSNKTTWQDIAKATPHANPIVLDANGKAQVYADGNYKFVITDSNDVTLYTHDNLLFTKFDGATVWAGSTTGSSNAYVATLTPALLALNNGSQICFVASFTNTGASTLNVNGVGADDIFISDGATATYPGALFSGQQYCAIYSTTAGAWVLLNSSPGFSTWTPTYGSQAGTFTIGSTRHASYYRDGQLCYVVIDFVGTLATATADYLTFTLPVPGFAISNGQFAAVAGSDDTTSHMVFILVPTGSSTARAYRADISDWTTTGNKVVYGNFFYRCGT